jgi:DNA gyrase subunit A
LSDPTGFDADIAPVAIEAELKRSYLDYAMSVIVSRALPDVRDGLKPVHRRILYAMKIGGYDSTKPFRKSARIVGDVMGQFHPHGDSAIYDAMVRMAQNFSMRLPLIDGQGNFGSMDGDPAAAMRYTEARLAQVAESLLADIDKNTVDFQPNYDEQTVEPVVLPARFPNLLVNGGGGIAVGMATNIPPHNLGEVIDACIAYIEDPDISLEALMEHVPGPDFPTGGQILGKSGIYRAYSEGNGSVMVRSRTHIETYGKDREAIIVTEIPYQVNKSRLIERIAEVVNQKIVEGISDLRDESDRDGVRIVIELKRDAVADVVLAQLFKYTPLQTSFGCNVLALNGGRPQTMTLREIIGAFVDFREQVITRRTVYELGKARERAHTLIGLAVAIANLDEMIRLIREASDPQVARERMLAKEWPSADVASLIRLVEADEKDESVDLSIYNTYRLSENQAKAILDLRLHRLTGLERDKIAADLTEVTEKIRDYLDILAHRERVMQIMVEEMAEIREKFGTPRRTELVEAEFEADIEDLIQREEMVVTLSHGGYIKRVPLSTYRAQRRGGKGRSGMATKDEDFVSEVFVTSTHTPLLFFSSRGMVYKLKVYRLPLGTPQSRGKALVNLLPLHGGETITTIMPLPEDEDTWGDWHVMFATSRGNVRRNLLSDFANIRANGLIAMKLDEGESLVSVKTCRPDQDVLLATASGMCIRFLIEDVRVFSGRTSTGVRGIRLEQDNEVISMSILDHVDASPEERSAYLKRAAALRRMGDEDEPEAVESDGEDSISGEIVLDDARFAEMAEREQFLLAISETGLGKRSSAYEYRVTGRGGKGIWNMAMTERVRAIAGCFPVVDEQQIMLVTDGGQLIRMPVAGIRIAGRMTQGVMLFRVAKDEKVVSVAVIDEGEEDEEDLEALEGEGGEDAAAPVAEAGEAPEAGSEPGEEA